MPRQKRQPLKGKTFVFTGALERFSRDEVKEHVEIPGGRATSSVSSQTDYVLVGSDPDSKLDNTKREDVELLDEDGFLAMVPKRSAVVPRTTV